MFLMKQVFRIRNYSVPDPVIVILDGEHGERQLIVDPAGFESYLASKKKWVV